MCLKLPFKGNYRVTQEFGNDLKVTKTVVENGVKVEKIIHWYAQWGLSGHDGVDYALPSGTPVLAPHDGKIIAVNYDANGYGIYVQLENSVEGSTLAHFQEATVKIGYNVKQGDQVGISDNTGNSTAPHLHWGYYRLPRNRSNGFDGYEDQTPYLNTEGTTNMADTPTLNTYGLDASNIASVQVVFDSWHDLASGKYLLKVEADKQLAAAEETINQLHGDIDVLKKTINDNFTFLGQVQDAGFHSIDEVSAVTQPYREMVAAGFPTLQAIKDKVSQLEVQNQALVQAAQATTTSVSENIELKTNLSELNNKYPTLNPGSVLNRIGKFLEWVKGVLAGKKVTTVTEAVEVVKEITPDQWSAFNQLLKGEQP